LELFFGGGGGHFKYCPDIIFDGEFTKNAGLLGQIAYSALRSSVHGEVGNLFIMQENPPLGWFDESNHHVKGCRFAGAVWSKQTYYFALLNIEGDIFNNRPSSILPNQIFCPKFDHTLCEQSFDAF
jgi:hypothetical protein